MALVCEILNLWDGGASVNVIADTVKESEEFVAEVVNQFA